MSATNLDLPVLITPDQIRRREFVTIRRGYDPDQVRAYMDQLADQVDLMQSLVREARREAETAIRAVERPPVDPYEELGKRVGRVIREADVAAHEIVTEARQDAERMTSEARTDADRIRTDAQARAEETRASADAAVREARAEADRTIAGLAVRRDALVEQLGSMQERLLAVAHDLERTIEIEGPGVDVPVTHGTPTEPDAPGPATDDAIGEEPDVGPPELAAGATTIEIVDTPAIDDPPAGGGASPTVPELSDPDLLLVDVDEVDYEELWAGTQAMRLELPQIPSLDLDWGDEDDDLDDTADD